MRYEGTITISAPRGVVWVFLTDPLQVAQCAPGVESVETLVPDYKFRAIAAIGFGSVKARFTGEVEFLELEPPTRAKLKAHGDAPGSAADVISEMFLTDGPDGTTEMRWSVDIVVLGTLASLAARLMSSITQKLTAQFFECLKSKIEA
ncbi:MAG TPA: carbon monoxide dehydrogenase subunit G [Anaerolineae bacterium]|nr:carbon monoxide dehydrogenase subunit G [Anaerolineae bacterium]